jgi:hypothetical protein
MTTRANPKGAPAMIDTIQWIDGEFVHENYDTVSL